MPLFRSSRLFRTRYSVHAGYVKYFGWLNVNPPIGHLFGVQIKKLVPWSPELFDLCGLRLTGSSFREQGQMSWDHSNANDVHIEQIQRGELSRPPFYPPPSPWRQPSAKCISWSSRTDIFWSRLRFWAASRAHASRTVLTSISELSHAIHFPLHRRILIAHGFVWEKVAPINCYHEIIYQAHHLRMR